MRVAALCVVCLVLVSNVDAQMVVRPVRPRVVFVRPGPAPRVHFLPAARTALPPYLPRAPYPVIGPTSPYPRPVRSPFAAELGGHARVYTGEVCFNCGGRRVEMCYDGVVTGPTGRQFLGGRTDQSARTENPPPPPQAVQARDQCVDCGNVVRARPVQPGFQAQDIRTRLVGQRAGLLSAPATTDDALVRQDLRAACNAGRCSGSQLRTGSGGATSPGETVRTTVGQCINCDAQARIEATTVGGRVRSLRGSLTTDTPTARRAQQQAQQSLLRSRQ